MAGLAFVSAADLGVATSAVAPLPPQAVLVSAERAAAAASLPSAPGILETLRPAGLVGGLAVASAALASRRRQHRNHRCHATVVAMKSGGLGEAPKAEVPVTTAQSIEGLVAAVKALVETKADKERSASTELRGEMSELKSQVAFLKKAYSDATNELEMTQVQMESQKASQPAVQARLKQFEQDATTLAEAKVAMQELAAALAASEEEKGVIAKEWDLMKAENSQLGQKMTMMVTERKQLEAELAESKANEEEMAKLLKQRELIQGEYKSLTDRFVQVNDEKAKLQEQLASVQVELGEARTTAPEGGQEVKRLTAQVVDATEENSRLRQQLTRFQDREAVSELEQLSVRETEAPSPEAAAPAPAAAGAKGTAEMVKQWLELLRLEKYFPALQEQGYDDLNILRDADAEEIGAIVKVVEMPRGHAKVFIRGLLQLAQAQQAEAVPA